MAAIAADVMPPDAAADDPRVIALLAIEQEGGPDLLTDEETEFLDRVFPSKRDRKVDPDRDHGANLAEFIEELELARIGQDVCEWFEEDEASRSEWMALAVRGMRATGATPNTDGGAKFDGASKTVHPALAEAVVQFNARAIVELWPSAGPVKARVLGRVTKDVSEQRDRVEDYMNYLYTEEMPGAFDEEDQLLYRLPLQGSMFKKIWHDPMQASIICSQSIEPADFVVPYSSASLATAPRYTHVQRFHPNAMRRLVATGYFIDVLLPVGGNEEYDLTDVHREIDDAQGVHSTSLEEDSRHTIYEMHVDLELSQFPDKDGKGRDSGLPLPYTVSVDSQTQRVLAIRRDWKESDKHLRVKRRRNWFVHKKFLPGWGFYGHGLYHSIGGLFDSATGSLRALLDAAAFANMQGGFRSRDARFTNKDEGPLEPGEFREVDASAEEMNKAFMPLRYGEPSSTLYQLLGYIDEKAQRFTSTTDALVGEGSGNIPVGTMLARIEQGTKITSAIHRRLHEANKSEYRMVAELVAEWLPDGRYPYMVADAEREVMRTDFDKRVDVVPASDPNASSTAQRMVVAEAVLEKAIAFPAQHDLRVALENYYRALKVANIDELLPDASDVPHAGPVDEGFAMATGKPVKAYRDQDHQAHMMVHEQWMSTQPPDQQQMLLPVFMAHMAEHRAHDYRIQVEQLIGMPLPPNPFDKGDDDDIPELPPEVEHEMTALTAQAVQGMAAERAQMEPQTSPEQIEAEAKAAAAAQETQARIERDNQLAAAEAQRKRDARILEEEGATAERARKSADMAADAAERRKQMVEDAKLKRDLMAAEAAERRRIEDARAHDERERRAQEAEETSRQRASEEAEKATKANAERERETAQGRAVKDVEAMKKAVDGLPALIDKAVAPIIRRVEALESGGATVARLAEAIERMEKAQAARDKEESRRRKEADKRRALIEAELTRQGDDSTKSLAAKLKKMH